MDATATDAVALEAVGRTYGERDALLGVTLTLPQGRSLAVLGANGAGKTTLLRLLAGLLRPTSGTAKVLGSTLPKESWAIRGRIGLLAHDPMLYRALTVRENLAHQARLLSAPAERVGELINAVGLSGRADEPLRTLSRGLIQRAAAARALLAAPELMLLDEPYANLDPGGQSLLQPLLEDDRSVVITGHDPESLLRGSDFAVGLKAGEAAFYAPSDQVSSADWKALYEG
ncbi:MAG: ATP-binding cassette domain-containing protein [Solirubrobacterales bacterium]|nr:ATP-binding cassette domain-containing protein [Solirubrobacterales bacterium]